MKANLNKCHLLLSTTDAFNFEISHIQLCAEVSSRSNHRAVPVSVKRVNVVERT